MTKFEGKRILYIAPKFFNYEQEIVKALEKKGAIVDYFDERPSNNFLTKVIIRLNLKKLISQRIKNYHNIICRETENIKYDYIFFISPETITREFIIKLKNEHKDAIFILYMWDSIVNKNSKNCIDLFDKLYTFDKTDLSYYDNFNFLPLFYLDEYKDINKNYKYKHDLSFVGTVHSDRYNILKKLKTQAENEHLKTFYYFYFHSKIYFWLRKFIDKNFTWAKYKEFSFKSLDKNEVIKILEESRAIIDIQHPRQIGLTMRTMEVLGAKRKLVTTNKDIVNYDFFNSKNICVIDRENPNIEVNFFKENFQELSDEIYNKYSLSNWLDNIFFNKGEINGK